MATAKKKSPLLEPGTKAPDFTLPDQNGKLVSLSDFLGKRVILYFYPKDMTPGCTAQACGFAELYPQIEEKGAVVIGISRDSVEAHKKFEETYHLPFILLSDPDMKAIEPYGIWQEKNMYGRISMGIVRSTYLINEEGVIEKALSRVRAKENPEKMLGLL